MAMILRWSFAPSNGVAGCLGASCAGSDARVGRVRPSGTIRGASRDKSGWEMSKGAATAKAVSRKPVTGIPKSVASERIDTKINVLTCDYENDLKTSVQTSAGTLQTSGGIAVTSGFTMSHRQFVNKEEPSAQCVGP